MLCFAMLAFLLSCNNETKKEDAAESKDKKEESKPAEAAPANMPYTAVYSSQFTPGDQKHPEKIAYPFKTMGRQ